MNIDRQAGRYRDIADIVYLLDVLVVVVHISYSNCWITYYCTRIEVSVLKAGWGWGPGWKFLVTEKKIAKIFSWGLKTQKKMKFFSLLNLGGGVWGAPRPHPGVARGRKTIHFFL